MSDAPRPSLARRTVAVAIAAIAGVTAILLFLCVSDTLTAPPPDGSTGYLPLTFFFTIGLLIGTVIGIPLCLLIGLPLWQVALWLGWHRRREAAGCGAASGAMIAVLLPLWFGGPVIAGGQDTLSSVGSFVIAGACAGLVAYQVAYPD